MPVEGQEATIPDLGRLARPNIQSLEIDLPYQGQARSRCRTITATYFARQDTELGNILPGTFQIWIPLGRIPENINIAAPIILGIVQRVLDGNKLIFVPPNKELPVNPHIGVGRYRRRNYLVISGIIESKPKLDQVEVVIDRTGRPEPDQGRGDIHIDSEGFGGALGAQLAGPLALIQREVANLRDAADRLSQTQDLSELVGALSRSLQEQTARSDNRFEVLIRQFQQALSSLPKAEVPEQPSSFLSLEEVFTTITPITIATIASQIYALSNLMNITFNKPILSEETISHKLGALFGELKNQILAYSQPGIAAGWESRIVIEIIPLIQTLLKDITQTLMVVTSSIIQDRHPCGKTVRKSLAKIEKGITSKHKDLTTAFQELHPNYSYERNRIYSEREFISLQGRIIAYIINKLFLVSLDSHN